MSVSDEAVEAARHIYMCPCEKHVTERRELSRIRFAARKALLRGWLNNNTHTNSQHGEGD